MSGGLKFEVLWILQDLSPSEKYTSVHVETDILYKNFSYMINNVVLLFAM